MLRYFLGFSYTRFSLVSSLIKTFTRSPVSHVFLLVVHDNLWMNVYHLDNGAFETVSADQFFNKRRAVTDMFAIPVVDRKAATRALLWFATHKTDIDILHVLRMAYEWLLNIPIAKHRVRYCTEGIAIFLLKARVHSMVEATERIVSPGEMLRWVIANNWKRIYGDKRRITLSDARGLDQARGTDQL